MGFRKRISMVWALGTTAKGIHITVGVAVFFAEDIAVGYNCHKPGAVSHNQNCALSEVAPI